MKLHLQLDTASAYTDVVLSQTEEDAIRISTDICDDIMLCLYEDSLIIEFLDEEGNAVIRRLGYAHFTKDRDEK